MLTSAIESNSGSESLARLHCSQEKNSQKTSANQQEDLFHQTGTNCDDALVKKNCKLLRVEPRVFVSCILCHRTL